MFGTPPSDATLTARVAQLEALVAALTGTVADNAQGADGAIDTVAAERQAGDAAALAAADFAVDAANRLVAQVDTRLGTEIQLRAAETSHLNARVSGLIGEVDVRVGLAEAYVLRAELADESIQIGADAKDTIAEARALVSVGDLFRAFGPGPTLVTYRKTGEVAQEQKIVIKSAELIDAEREAVRTEFSPVLRRGAIGRASITSTAATSSTPGTYIFHDQPYEAAQITALRIRNPFTGSRTVTIGRHILAEGVFTAVPGQTWTSVLIPAGAGTFTVPCKALKNEGEYFGISAEIAAFAYDVATGDSGGYYFSATAQAGTINQSGLVTNVRLLIGADYEYVAATPSKIDDLQSQLDANVTSIGAAQSDLIAQMNALDQIATRNLEIVGTPRNYASAGSYTPGNDASGFFEWAVGVRTGVNVPDNARLSAIRTTLYYGAAVARVEACLFSRAHSGNTNLAPNGTDAQEWPSWVSVDVADLGFAPSSFGDYIWLSPDGYAPLAAGKHFYLRVRAYYADDTRAPSGMGNCGALAVTSGANLERGFFRLCAKALAATQNWAAVSDVGSLAVAVYDYAYEVKEAASAHSVEVGLLTAAYVELAATDLTVTLSGYVRRYGGKEQVGAAITHPAPTAGFERVDLIVAARTNGAIARVAGTERAADLDAQEWQPAIPANSILLARVLVTPTTATPVNAAQFRGLIKVGRESEFAAHVLRNRQCLRRTLGKAARAAPIKLGITGDSLTAFQSIAGQAGMPYTANGPLRDRYNSYFAGYPSDTLALLPKYDFGDGLGAEHIKVGIGWWLKAGLDAIAGAEVVDYRNYGIGGTTSAATQYNGLYPARMAAQLADNLDVAGSSFGMNERGSTSTYANTVNIIGQHQANGSETFVIGVQRPNATQSLSNWRYTNEALYAAAMDTGSAYISTLMVADDQNLGAMIPAQMLGALTEQAGPGNHGGIFEHSIYGRAAQEQLGI